MTAIRVFEKAANIDVLALAAVEVARPQAGPQQCLIEVHGAGVNPSDVKATLGAMPHAVWPRTPGRDYAGIVLEGPQHLIGKAVWGSGGELGIGRDGTHARYLLVDTHSVREKPAALSMLEASAVGVPFITAYEGLRRAGMPQKGDVVLVCGGNGKVGQAAIQLATRAGARVFGVERTSQGYRGHASSAVDMIDASTTDIADYVRQQTGGHGADIVYNTVGSPYFEQANRAMAKRARQIFISTIDRAVPFDIFAFYRGQHTYVGIDTLVLDSADGAEILDHLMPGFNDGSLKPFPVLETHVYSLDNAIQAYRAVLGGSAERVVVRP
ncbi:zinc-binding alcohol dehydrogenase family protein [Oxalobacteraceae bacterium CAVE-383]|nr:zinc-binding alcohol dehydrogenase family protein [Oxalobacteraceae bacterium CAVE-383]